MNSTTFFPPDYFLPTRCFLTPRIWSDKICDCKTPILKSIVRISSRTERSAVLILCKKTKKKQAKQVKKPGEEQETS